jgi:hypothetical protein
MADAQVPGGLAEAGRAARALDGAFQVIEEPFLACCQLRSHGLAVSFGLIDPIIDGKL